MLEKKLICILFYCLSQLCLGECLLVCLCQLTVQKCKILTWYLFGLVSWAMLGVVLRGINFWLCSHEITPGRAPGTLQCQGSNQWGPCASQFLSLCTISSPVIRFCWLVLRLKGELFSYSTQSTCSTNEPHLGTHMFVPPLLSRPDTDLAQLWLKLSPDLVSWRVKMLSV